ncbi:hypothetical protein [Spirosoma utsteinense]|uniref:Carboxypeptidase regulatory-like domain-containing protein n=1 Tax=Spirosoma utsteinense TaxID=2585773 RepID=A0ABR6WBB2_9BACT|nr:hypothetical protein [Spirosoma utsteinense]MBC3786427.1 hypothetical protein [Spirosoma utsteinense]MBC3793863.1 hypothetical protein [Spirosoma utsteinense]
MRFNLFYPVYVLMLLVSTACERGGPETPPPPAALQPATTFTDPPRSDIRGFVTLCDEFGVVKAKSDSMIVSLEGLQTAFPARTRPEGRFTIANVFGGNYNLSYNKPRSEYGNFKQIGIVHTGGLITVANSVTIWERAKTVPSNLSVSIKGLNLTLSGVTGPVQPVGTADEQKRRVRLFFGRDEKVSHLSYVTTWGQVVVPPGSTGEFAEKLLADELQAFQPGERVYVIAYGITAFENAYVDPETKRKVYTGINPTPSNVVSFILP